MSQLGQKEQFEKPMKNADLGPAKFPEGGQEDVTSAVKGRNNNSSGMSITENQNAEANPSPGIH
jgi:hypothetical protein